MVACHFLLELEQGQQLLTFIVPLRVFGDLPLAREWQNSIHGNR
jgi:hypothetical protein